MDRNQIKALLNRVQELKLSLVNAENNRFVTNGEFRFAKTAALIDIKTEKRPGVLVDILEFLITKETAWTKAAAELGVTGQFEYLGATLGQWINDLKLRMTQLQLATRREELLKAESALFALSPELASEVQFEKIEALVAKLSDSTVGQQPKFLTTLDAVES